MYILTVTLLLLKLTVFGYSSTQSQTDDSPSVTASGTSTRVGTLALSRDLLDSAFAYGDTVVLGGKLYVVEDTMHPRHRRSADIWFPTRRQALEWGKRKLHIRKYVPLRERMLDAPLPKWRENNMTSRLVVCFV